VPPQHPRRLGEPADARRAGSYHVGIEHHKRQPPTPPSGCRSGKPRIAFFSTSVSQ
jgi:hypothetical protein